MWDSNQIQQTQIIYNNLRRFNDAESLRAFVSSSQTKLSLFSAQFKTITPINSKKPEREVDSCCLTTVNVHKIPPDSIHFVHSFTVFKCSNMQWETWEQVSIKTGYPIQTKPDSIHFLLIFLQHACRVNNEIHNDFCLFCWPTDNWDYKIKPNQTLSSKFKKHIR